MSIILNASDASVVSVVNQLTTDNVVAIPTETVYGLAANAYSTKAVMKIFEYKQRPSLNPLIVHYDQISSVAQDAICSDLFYKLSNEFSPGPLTYILNKKKESKISDYVSAGLDTIAVRVPNHLWTQKILSKLKFPLAAPSANLSTKLTTTTAIDVGESLNIENLYIFDGGKSVIGIESTVIDLTTDIPVVLRHGIISIEEISDVLKMQVLNDDKTVGSKCPGRMLRHYATEKPLFINSNSCTCDDGFLTCGDFDVSEIPAKKILNLSMSGDLYEAAGNLFSMLKELDKSDIKNIHVCKISTSGIGMALNDRLIRASCRSSE